MAVKLPAKFPKSKRGSVRQHNALIRKYMNRYLNGGMFGYDTRTLKLNEPALFDYLTRLEREFDNLPE